jgi:hypothetical protein
MALRARRRAGGSSLLPRSPQFPPPPSPPQGWTVAAVAGSPVLGSAILFWWPPVDEDWQLGRVRRRSRKAPFTHVVGYRLAFAAFVGTRLWTRPRTALAGPRSSQCATRLFPNGTTVRVLSTGRAGSPALAFLRSTLLCSYGQLPGGACRENTFFSVSTERVIAMTDSESDSEILLLSDLSR